MLISRAPILDVKLQSASTQRRRLFPTGSLLDPIGRFGIGGSRSAALPWQNERLLLWLLSPEFVLLHPNPERRPAGGQCMLFDHLPVGWWDTSGPVWFGWRHEPTGSPPWLGWCRQWCKRSCHQADRGRRRSSWTCWSLWLGPSPASDRSVCAAMSGQSKKQRDV